jgi:LmbE family N-acetylglucosaminyl deacetylase
MMLGCAGAPAPQPSHPLEHAPAGELIVPVADRMLLIAPHPDDETLAAAGLSQRVLTRIGTVRTLVLTAGEAMLSALSLRAGHGEPRREALAGYGALRQREARQAARLVGDGKIRLQLLGFPDRGLLPFGLGPAPRLPPGADIELSRRMYPAASGASRDNLYTPRLSATAKAVQASIVRALRETPPTLVVFPDPLDMHPDHRAAGLYTLLAIREYMRGREGPWPRMLAYLIHFDGWPPGSQAGAGPLPLEAALDLPATLPGRGQSRWCLPLTPRERERKREALAAYDSQRQVMPEFLAAFASGSECFSENTPLDAELTTMQMRPASSGSATLEPGWRR